MEQHPIHTYQNLTKDCHNSRSNNKLLAQFPLQKAWVDFEKPEHKGYPESEKSHYKILEGTQSLSMLFIVHIHKNLEVRINSEHKMRISKFQESRASALQASSLSIIGELVATTVIFLKAPNMDTNDHIRVKSVKGGIHIFMCDNWPAF